MILEILLLLLAASILFLLLTLGWGIGAYNTFREGQQDIKTQWSNILTEYQRRADLFYNLVQTVKSAKNFEKGTLVEVTAARSGNFGQTKGAQMSKLKSLDGMFQKLMVVFERYPKLQAVKTHEKLLTEMRITEDRINVARTDYNEIVGDYNKLVLMFPKNIIASMFRFSVEPFFESQKGTEIAPKINLE